MFSSRFWIRLFLTLVLLVMGILLPLFIFLMSAMLVSDWKGGCHLGWVDCFHAGKLALTPLVLWATAAFFAVEICRVQNRTRPWIVFGYLLGAVISSICTVFGFISVGIDGGLVALWLLVPGYVALYYSIRSVQLIKSGGYSIKSCVLAVCGSIPFWIASIIWSRKIYSALPDQPPSCFIVTAAACGHKAFVGPFVEIQHHGHRQEANQQLLTLWQLEAMWSVRAPRSHRHFRRVYNIVGPIVARRITTPFVADVAYLAIKPMEMAARLILYVFDLR